MDTFAQVTIPLIVLLALRVKTRKAVLLLPATLLIDLDVFFRYHRLLFHNLFVAFFLPLLIVFYVRKYHPEYFDYAWIGLFYVFTSLLFDLGQGVALFYPLTSNFYFFKASIYVQIWHGLPLPDPQMSYGIWAPSQTIAVGEKLGAAETSARYASMSETSVGLLFTLIVAALMYFRKSQTFLKEVWELILDIMLWIRDTFISIFKIEKR